MNNPAPKLGDLAICSMCGAQIMFVGPYWDHQGKNKPRHPATPQVKEPIPWEQRMQERYSMIPYPVFMRSRDDVVIYNGIRKWAESDQPVDWLLAQLVLALSDANAIYAQQIQDLLRTRTTIGGKD